MAIELEQHYELMKSGNWRVGRSNAGLVFYYQKNVVNAERLLLEEAYDLEMIIRKKGTMWGNYEKSN